MRVSPLYKEFIELYEFRFYFVFCNDLVEAMEEVKTLNDYATWFNSKSEAIEWLNSSTAVYFTTKDNDRILFVPWNVSSDVIAHECFHIAYALMKDRGIGMSDASEEAWAYLIGYIVKLANKRKKQANAERKAARVQEK